MPWRILSPSEAYGELMKHAAVVVEVRDSVQDILEWHPKSKTKAGLIAFVDPRRRVSLLEISFGTATAYGRKRRDPVLPPRKRELTTLAPLQWEFVKWVILMLARERCFGQKKFFLNRYGRAGEKFFRVGKSLKVRGYTGQQKNGFQRPIQRGLLLGVSSSDPDLLRRFLAEETNGIFWQVKRLPWFAETINRLMAGWGRRSREGVQALRQLVLDPNHVCFLRHEVLRALLPHIAKREWSLEVLLGCKAICFPEHEELLYELLRPRKRERKKETVTLDFVFRGERRNGSYRFEVFPEEERR